MTKLALDQGHSFGVEEIPDFTEGGSGSSEELMTAIEFFKTNKGVTDKDLAALHRLMCQSPDHYLVASRILRKDLRCGIQAKTVNKVRPGLIFRVPYQRCSSGPEALAKITFPARLERKANGMFAYMFTDGTFMTRNGQRFTIPGNPVSARIESPDMASNLVLIGELVFVDENEKPLPRAISNGFINSFIKGEGADVDVSRLRAFVWNMITPSAFSLGADATSTGTSFTCLTHVFHGADPIKPIEHWIVNSLAEAQAKTNELIAAGEEGAVLKSLSPYFVWEDHSASPYQVKMKAEAEAEFVIVDWYYGDQGKKYENMLGGIVVRSADHLIVSEVGSGFSDKQRAAVDSWRLNVGQVCTIKFNGVTEKAGSDVRALDHPRFVEMRKDKDEADTLEYCLNELKGGLKG